MAVSSWKLRRSDCSSGRSINAAKPLIHGATNQMPKKLCRVPIFILMLRLNGSSSTRQTKELSQPTKTIKPGISRIVSERNPKFQVNSPASVASFQLSMSGVLVMKVIPGANMIRAAVSKPSTVTPKRDCRVPIGMVPAATCPSARGWRGRRFILMASSSRLDYSGCSASGAY